MKRIAFGKTSNLLYFGLVVFSYFSMNNICFVAGKEIPNCKMK